MSLYHDDPEYRAFVDQSTRLDADATHAKRTDAIPSIGELHRKSVEASRDRWKQAPNMPGRADAATSTPAPPATPTERALRTDASAPIPKISDLYARSVENSRNAWKNSTGHGR
jgi:hypothetical protein